MEFITGWAIVLGLAATSSLALMNYLNPLQGDGRMWAHRAIGKFTMVATVAHLLSVPFNGFDNFAIWTSIFLVFVTAGTGMILSYLPESGAIRYHAKSIHPALIIAIAISVAHHVMVALEIL
jgi:hypothetical protein